MRNQTGILTLRFCLIVLAQVFFLNHVHLGDFAPPYLYVLFILLFPMEPEKTFSLLCAFALGLTVDIFEQSVGVHAAAAVLIAVLRPLTVPLLSPSTIRSKEGIILFAVQTRVWMLIYFSVFLLIHQIALFFFGQLNFHGFSFAFPKLLMNTLLSLLVNVIVYILFFDKKNE